MLYAKKEQIPNYQNFYARSPKNVFYNKIDMSKEEDKDDVRAKRREFLARVRLTHRTLATAFSHIRAFSHAC